MEVISSEERKELKFKGTQVAYAVVCPRKLWLFSKGITMEHTSDRVALGKFLDEESFKREEGFSDENVSIDFITSEEGIVVHEVKSSKALEEAHIMQVKYYIYYLRNKGVLVSHGLLHYPRLRKIERVELTEGDIKELESVLSRIEEVLSLPTPPKVIDKPYCKKCAYYELCYG